ncbi:MAG: hypothetical protein AAGC46_11445, partial [Solirubrobacteraceae bacterium]|nr:hypothetical protein [Patulibacter sp.]
MTHSSDPPHRSVAPLRVVEDPRTPGQGDAIRATVGVVAAYGAGLLLAALVALLTAPDGGEVRSAGSTRAQLAVQAVIFGALAFLLVEGLRLARRPRSHDPLANPAPERTPRRPVPVVFAVG